MWRGVARVFVVLSAAVGVVSADGGVGTWGPTYGPDGGWITALAVDSQNPKIVYAGSGSPCTTWIPGGGGIFKSIDGGRSWHPANTGVPTRMIGSLAIDPVQPRTIYAATGRGVLKSTNGGSTWRPSGLTRSTCALAVAEAAPTTLYAAAQDAPQVFRSTDGGATWHSATLAATPRYRRITALAIDPVAPSTVYASLEDVVVKSTDGGRTWRRTSLKSRFVWSLAIDRGPPVTVYAAGNPGLFRSTDGGRHWTRTKAKFAITIATDPRRSGTVYAGGISYSGSAGVAVSRDRGETWTRPFDRMDVLALAVAPRGPEAVYAGGIGGMARGENGARTWRDADGGLTNVSTATLAVHPAKARTIYLGTNSETGMRCLYRSTDGGRRWSGLLPSAETPYERFSECAALAFDPTRPDTVYAGTNRGLSKSTDGGKSWRVLPTPEWISAVAVDPRTPTTVYAGSMYVSTSPVGMLKSTDGGATWAPINSGLSEGPVTGIAVDPQAPSRIYAIMSHRLYRSENGGESWGTIRRNIPGRRPVLVLDPKTPSTLYLGTGQGIRKSDDAGQTWRSLDGMATKDVVTLVIDPQRTSTLYAGTPEEGVFRTTDGGQTWRPFNEGLAQPWIDVLAIDSSGTRLYAATAVGVSSYDIP